MHQTTLGTVMRLGPHARETLALELTALRSVTVAAEGAVRAAQRELDQRKANLARHFTKISDLEDALR